MPRIKINTKYQFYLDKLRELNLDDLDKSWDKEIGRASCRERV